LTDLQKYCIITVHSYYNEEEPIMTNAQADKPEVVHVGMSEARTRFADLAEMAHKGITVIIERYGAPYLQLIAIEYSIPHPAQVALPEPELPPSDESEPPPEEPESPPAQ
jgi:antitoxin (DNA-binding transcriptional repressor) of toxin-antitoxin stability system